MTDRSNMSEGSSFGAGSTGRPRYVAWNVSKNKSKEGCELVNAASQVTRLATRPSGRTVMRVVFRTRVNS